MSVQGTYSFCRLTPRHSVSPGSSHTNAYDCVHSQWAGKALSHASCYREELNEGVRLQIVRALAVWAPALDTLPADVVQQFSKGLKEKENLQRAHLRALIQARPAP